MAGSAPTTLLGKLRIQPVSRHVLYVYGAGRVLDVQDVQRAMSLTHVHSAELKTAGRTEPGYCLVVILSIDVQPRHLSQLAELIEDLRCGLAFAEVTYEYGPEHPQSGRTAPRSLREWVASV